jgi:hypothetical protein
VPRDDRRFFAPDINNQWADGKYTEKKLEYFKTIRNPELTASFAKYLYELDVAEFVPFVERPTNTRTIMKQKLQSMSCVESMVFEWLKEGKLSFPNMCEYGLETNSDKNYVSTQYLYKICKEAHGNERGFPENQTKFNESLVNIFRNEQLLKLGRKRISPAKNPTSVFIFGRLSELRNFYGEHDWPFSFARDGNLFRTVDVEQDISWLRQNYFKNDTLVHLANKIRARWLQRQMQRLFSGKNQQWFQRLWHKCPFKAYRSIAVELQIWPKRTAVDVIDLVAKRQKFR